MAERLKWQEFGRSTFTHIGRNDLAVRTVIELRRSHGLPQTNNVVLFGPGIVEPFTIAALPGLEKATIFAVEPDQELHTLAHDVKLGKSIPWLKIGQVSCNTQLDEEGRLVKRENTDFTDKERINSGINVLKIAGSLQSLGDGFDQEVMSVPAAVRDRVIFIEQDALDLLDNGGYPSPDICGDFFLRVNINKHPEGGKYSREMTRRTFELMPDNGIIIIGDTGKNLPQTLGDLESVSTNGNLNLASLVHAVNFGRGYATSHYLIASKMTNFAQAAGIDNAVRERLYDEASAFAQFGPTERSLTVGELAELTKEYVNLAYLAGRNSDKKGTAWNSDTPIDQALAKVVPYSKSEFSEDLALPAQKPHLRTYFVHWGDSKKSD